VKLLFEFERFDRLRFEVEVPIDYRAQPYHFERALKKELLARKLVSRSNLSRLDFMAMTPDGSVGAVFVGPHRRGVWHRAGA
jgi:hypothetical protein